nr:unnamed protein product [Callosobruchus analis]
MYIFRENCCGITKRLLEANTILPEIESRFRKGHGFSTALLNTIDKIITAKDAGEYALLILLDFSPAFDTLNHVMLLNEIHRNG